MEDKKHIAWVYGGYHARRALMSRINQKFSDCEKFISNGDITFEYLSVQLQETGCFSDKKIVVINSMPQFKGTNKATYINKFKTILNNLDDNIFVVFNGIDPNKEKALFEHAKKLGSKIYSYPDLLNSNEAINWLIERFKSQKYELGVQEADAIIASSGYDASLSGIGIDRLEMAMQKIILYQGNKKKISIDSVAATATSIENFVVWDLLNAMENRSYLECLVSLSRANTVSHDIIATLNQVLPVIYWKFRLLWFLKDKISNTNDMTASAKMALSMPKLPGTGSDLNRKMEQQLAKTGENKGKPIKQWSRFVVQSALEGSNGKEPIIDTYSRRDLYKIIRTLQTAIIVLRRGISEAEALLIADIIFMTTCNIGEDENIRLIMKSFEEVV